MRTRPKVILYKIATPMKLNIYSTAGYQKIINQIHNAQNYFELITSFQPSI